MTGSDDRDQLLRELAFWKQEYDALGARLLRAQDAQSRASREARRSRMVADLISEAHRISNLDLAAEAIGERMLAKIVESFCERGVLLKEDPNAPGAFVVEHAIGLPAGQRLTLPNPPAFLFTASDRPPEPPAAALAGLLGVPFVLWAYEGASGRALLLGNQTESNIRRPFEAGDQELIRSALTVYIDILLRILAEATLRQAKVAAEEANAVRARFLAILSHELRTPLNAIIGFSELLLQTGTRAPAPPQREEFARQILDAGRALLALVKDILDFSSFSNARPRLRRDWVPVGQILESMKRAFAAESALRGIDVTLEPPDPTLLISIDYDRFRQILANLIGNAIKFTAMGGRVDIAGREIPGQGAAITIRDNGVGMRPEDIPRALEPFVQLENMRRHSIPGTGLGLPIAKQLVEAHQGQLTIESTYGEGTCITILLPEAFTTHAAPARP
jgi:signal transduction histidine kinase